MDSTVEFNKVEIENAEIDSVLRSVLNSLSVKGYNPIDQLTGYIMSGDPTYITSYMGARAAISNLDAYDVLNRLISVYSKHLGLDVIPANHRKNR